MKQYQYSHTFDPKKRLSSGSWLTCACGWRGRISIIQPITIRQDGSGKTLQVVYPCPRKLTNKKVGPRCGLILAEDDFDSKSASIGAVLPAVPPPPPAEATGQEAYESARFHTQSVKYLVTGLLEKNEAILQYPTLEELVSKLSMDLVTLHDAILHLEQKAFPKGQNT